MKKNNNKISTFITVFITLILTAYFGAKVVKEANNFVDSYKSAEAYHQAQLANR